MLLHARLQGAFGALQKICEDSQSELVEVENEGILNVRVVPCSMPLHAIPCRAKPWRVCHRSTLLYCI